MLQIKDIPNYVKNVLNPTLISVSAIYDVLSNSGRLERMPEPIRKIAE